MNRTIGILMYMSIFIFSLVSFIATEDRFTWLLESIWVFIGLAILVYLNKNKIYPTSILSYSLFIHSLILIYGAWFTYELNPTGAWISDIMNWDRNHYDRLGHFAQGFFPMILFREVLTRNKVISNQYWLELINFAGIMAFTAIFEIIEFSSFLAFSHKATAFLGSQGDIWDAQWDMLFCGIGGIISLVFLSKIHTKQIQHNQSK